MIRVGIVNDVRLALEVLRRVVISVPDAEVAWTAEDGREAVEKCLADKPDLILMDLIMPVMDGVEATRRIMQQSPCPILVVTATVSGNCDKVFEALGHGAVDAVNTPVFGRDGNVAGGDELMRKIRAIVRLRCGKAAGWDQLASTISAPSTGLSRPMSDAVPLLAIGASTGGPQAIADVLTRLHPPLNYAVVVVQHLDRQFVPGLVEWLSRETGMNLRVIEAGQRPTVETVHVACTSDHLVLTSAGDFQYVREPVDHVYRPSVDVFFHSLVRAPVPSGVALLLTGMGRDGAIGMQTLHQAGWQTVAQDQASSIVWGMPRAAVQLGAADQVLPLDQIGAAISHLMKAT